MNYSNFFFEEVFNCGMRFSFLSFDYKTCKNKFEFQAAPVCWIAVLGVTCQSRRTVRSRNSTRTMSTSSAPPTLQLGSREGIRLRWESIRFPQHFVNLYIDLRGLFIFITFTLIMSLQFCKFQVIVQVTTAGCVLTWDFDILKHECEFIVYYSAKVGNKFLNFSLIFHKILIFLKTFFFYF